MWYEQIGLGIGALGWSFTPLLLVLVLWSLAWKGLALWRAAKLGSRGWFVALLIINTLGVLEILYLYIISKKSRKPVDQIHDSSTN